MNISNYGKQETKDAINKYQPGRELFTCRVCCKKIWLQEDIMNIYQQDGRCLDCRNAGRGD